MKQNVSHTAVLPAADADATISIHHVRAGGVSRLNSEVKVDSENCLPGVEKPPSALLTHTSNQTKDREGPKCYTHKNLLQHECASE